MTLEARNLDTPDDKRTFEHGALGIVNLPGVAIARGVLEPGWKWSVDIKPMAGTDSCQIAHHGVVLSGRFHVRMDDGQEIELGPGDAHVVSPGHDAWVVGDEPCTVIDFAATEA
jgi:mannose-6-phosphate isomerase-like protein (cupin superfamily)